MTITGTGTESTGTESAAESASENATPAALAEEARAVSQRLQRLTGLLSAATSLQEVAQIGVEQIAAVLRAAGGVMALHHPDEGVIRIVSSCGIQNARLASFRTIPVDAPIPAAQTIRQRSAVLIGSPAEMAATYPHLVADLDPRFSAWACIPFIIEERVVGVAWFLFREPRTFAEPDLALIATIGQQAAAAIVRAQLFEGERQARARVERVLDLTRRFEEITRRVSRAMSVDEMTHAAIDGAHAAFGADSTTLFIVDGDHLSLLRAAGLKPILRDRYQRIPLALDTPVAAVARTGEAIHLGGRAEFAARFPAAELRLRPLDGGTALALVCVPLLADGQVLGVMNFTFRHDRSLDADERRFTSLLADHCALALARARSFADLRATALRLGHANRTLEAIISACPAAVTLLGTDGTVHLWNEAAERILGWTRDEATGSFLPAIARDQREEFLRTLQGIARGERQMGEEARRLTKSRGPIDVALWSALVETADGDVQCLSLMVDISDRHRADAEREDARRAAQETADYLTRLQKVTIAFATAATPREVAGVVVREGVDALGALLAGVAVPDLEGDLTLIDHAGAIGPLVATRRRFSRTMRTPLAIAFSTGQTFIAGNPREIAEHCPDFEIDVVPSRPQALVAVPVLVGDLPKAAIGFGFAQPRSFGQRDLAFLHDLATLTALALQRAELYEGEREARTVAEQALQQARDADRRKDEFLAMLGHELRNPLAPISTALQLAKLRPSDPFAREHAIIARQVDHLERLVDDLLDVSRITRGKIELSRETVELADVVGKAIDVASPLLEQRSHHLQVEVPRGLTVDGDPVRLCQVLTNLLTNAAKYTDAGGRIAISATRDGEQVALTVRDNGVGIDAELLPRVFEMFTQAPQTIDRSRGGLGLGLTIVKQIVELHGGRVEARSEGAGHGSAFTIRLPLISSATAADPLSTAATPSSASVAARPTSPPRRVLIVDDNEDGADLLAELLREVGHEVHIAFDGPSALALARRFPPDVACLDIGLPVMDGYELARRLVKEAQRPLTLIAITGYGQDQDRARATAAGFARHMVKPVNLDELLAACALD